MNDERIGLIGNSKQLKLLRIYTPSLLQMREREEERGEREEGERGERGRIGVTSEEV